MSVQELDTPDTVKEKHVGYSIHPGYKQTEVGLIPEDWRVSPVSELCYLQRGFDLTAASSELGTIPVFSSSGISYFHNEAKVEPPILITGRKGLLGKVFLVKEPAWPHDTTLWATDFLGNVPEFVALVLEAFHLERLDAATSVPTLNRNNLTGYRVAIPSEPAEQKAIAEALGDADALVESLERLLAKKRNLKQAAMQQLLTGKKRLPGFEGEWEECNVSDVIHRSFSGPSPTCEERNVQGSEWGVLKTTAITWQNGWDWTRHKTLPRAFWNQPDLEIRSGDVIVTKAGPRHRVGVTACVDFVPERILPSGKMIALRPITSRVISRMLAAAIASPVSQEYLDQRSTGMAEAQVNFENNNLLDTPIKLPTMAEQTAIVEVLSDIDAEITAIEAKIDKARQIKAGVMQELLTGKTRLVSGGNAK